MVNKKAIYIEALLTAVINHVCFELNWLTIDFVKFYTMWDIG